MPVLHVGHLGRPRDPHGPTPRHGPEVDVEDRARFARPGRESSYRKPLDALRVAHTRTIASAKVPTRIVRSTKGTQAKPG